MERVVRLIPIVIGTKPTSRTITLRQVQGDIHFEMTLKIINENIGI